MTTATFAPPSNTTAAELTRRGRRGPLRGWRPALRIAARTAWRDKGRTALVLALVALPVMAMTFLSVLTHAQALPPAAQATRAMGSADAYATVSTSVEVQAPSPSWGVGVALPTYDPDGAVDAAGDPPSALRDPTTVDLAALLPPGSTVQPAPTRTSDDQLTAGSRTIAAIVVGGGLGEPLTAGMSELTVGHAYQGPGEIVLSATALGKLGVHLGDAVTIAGEPVTVTGQARDPSCLDCVMAWRSERAPGARGAGGSIGYLVGLPPGANAHKLWQSLAPLGVAFLPRAAVLAPQEYEAPYETAPGGSANAGTVGVAAFGLLEVVLLAGAAFAVGTRRQIRELGWVAANGGTGRDVRRIVLAQGVVAGAVAAVIGVAVGLLGFLALQGPLQRLSNAAFAGLVVSWRELVGIAAFALVAAILAAVTPAVLAARMPVMAALRDAPAPASTAARRRALFGLLLLVVGIALALGASLRFAAVDAAFETNMAADTGAAPGHVWMPPSSSPYSAVMSVGLVLLVPAVILLTPAVLAGLAKLARRWPFALRLAARDAYRQSHRTTPTIVAIVLVVAGSVSLCFVGAASDARDRAAYVPAAPPGVTVVTSGDGKATLTASQESQLSAILGTTAVTFTPAEHGPYSVTVLPQTPCTSPRVCDDEAGTLLIGTSEALSATLGTALPTAAVSVLTDGGAVRLAGSRSGADPTVTLTTEGWTKRLPGYAVGAPRSMLGAAVVTPDTAQALGVSAGTTIVVFPAGPTPPTDEQVALARGVIDDTAIGLEVGRPYRTELGPWLLAVAGASGVITLGAVAIAISLAAAEGRRDLATLGAIGASPRRRRSIAMAQAGVVAVLATALGVGLGTLASAAMHFVRRAEPWTVPWSLLALIGVVVPVLAIAVAGLATRSRLPMIRRLG